MWGTFCLRLVRMSTLEFLETGFKKTKQKKASGSLYYQCLFMSL